jgi:hypothetical protein
MPQSPTAPHSPAPSRAEVQHPAPVALAPESLTGTEPLNASRRVLLSGAFALACGAAASVLARPSGAIDAVGNTDAQSLRFLEEIEALQSDFFNRAGQSSAFEAMEQRERDIISTIAEQDRKHLEWFRLARRRFGVAEFGRMYTPNASQSRPVRVFTFSPAVFGSKATLLPMAIRLKDTSVAAYHGVVGRASNGEIVEALAALAGIEGRHSAALRELARQNPLDSAFEAAISPTVAVSRLKEFGLRGESTP